MKQGILIFLTLLCAAIVGGGFFLFNVPNPIPANENIPTPEIKETPHAGAVPELPVDEKEVVRPNTSVAPNLANPEDGNPPTLEVTPEQYFYMTPAGQAFREAGEKHKRKMKADELGQEDLAQCMANLISVPLERQVSFIVMSDNPDLRDYLRFLLDDLRVARLLTLAQAGSDTERTQLLELVKGQLAAILEDKGNTASFFSRSGGEYGGAVALPLILAKFAPTPEHLGMLSQLYDRSLAMEGDNSMQNMGQDPEFNSYNATRILLAHACTQMLTAVANAAVKDASQFSQVELAAIQSYEDFVEDRVKMTRQFVELNSKHNVLGEELDVDAADRDALFQLYLEAAEGIHMIMNNQGDYQNPAGRDRQELMNIAREFTKSN